jgi:hypothetical protein
VTSGSKYRIVGWGASTVFGPVLESSRPPSTCIMSLYSGRGVSSQVCSWRGCLTRSFPLWHHLLSRGDEVDGLASAYTGLRLIAVCWGDQTSPQGAAWSCGDSACREEEASWDVVIG